MLDPNSNQRSKDKSSLDLRQVPLFAHLSDDELQCLSQGKELKLKAGTQIAKQGDPPDGFYIILEGKTEWTRTVSGQEVHAVTLKTGDVFAELILLLDEPYPTTGRALTEVRLYKLEPEDFWKMLALCPKILRQILKISAERSQIHESVTQQQAKFISLGTLSAGLAHELNNPAAAVRRGVKNLAAVLQRLPALALKLHQQPLSQEQITFLSDLYQATSFQDASRLDPLTRSELEDAVMDWLDTRDIPDAWNLAPTLVAAGIDTEALEQINSQIAPDCLSNVLAWLEATLDGAGLLNEIQHSTERISELVAAIKDYSYRDQAPLQEIDLHAGIESTLTMLNHKLKQGVVVHREYGDLPSICAYGRQLNQVWTNLIDNAIQATGGKGQIWIRTSIEGDRSRLDDPSVRVLVEIADDGVGIPADVAPRIFEQFFTTKDVGSTGLGLDISRRIVEGQHQGNIRFESKPGDTRFQVRLPLSPARHNQ